ncbi:hypothetical protein WICPIJ_001267 [Wickerhamomyces pijperi]|uniref:Uncharacterized protein n=1 Tax=Wickerhamomyces pijperi TaxID=599730 RepID=A0A9P8QB32_WICPI|nr:hypothetical protein WICPIJ_001267 [Wickerhamomyces pijperi]
MVPLSVNRRHHVKTHSQPGLQMPANVAVEHPDTRVVSDESDQCPFITLDLNGVSLDEHIVRSCVNLIVVLVKMEVPGPNS